MRPTPKRQALIYFDLLEWHLEETWDLWPGEELRVRDDVHDLGQDLCEGLNKGIGYYLVNVSEWIDDYDPQTGFDGGEFEYTLARFSPDSFNRYSFMRKILNAFHTNEPWSTWTNAGYLAVAVASWILAPWSVIFYAPLAYLSWGSFSFHHGGSQKNTDSHFVDITGIYGLQVGILGVTAFPLMKQLLEWLFPDLTGVVQVEWLTVPAALAWSILATNRRNLNSFTVVPVMAIPVIVMMFIQYSALHATIFTVAAGVIGIWVVRRHEKASDFEHGLFHLASGGLLAYWVAIVVLQVF
jgi:hypothetical protein